MTRTSCTISWLLASATCLLGWTSPAAADEPLALEAGQLYLVFDPRLHGVGEQCELKVHSFSRHPANPVVKPEYPWEGLHHSPKLKPGIQLRGFIQITGTVLWEPEEGIFRMWYYGSIDEQSYTCYAVSKDGVHWDKPMLGLHEVLGTRQNNVSSYGEGGAAIHRDRQATDPARRYVKWSMQSRNGDDGIKADYSIYRHFSSDGLRWGRESRIPAIPGHPTTYLGGVAGDVVTTYWFERLGKHVCFLKCQVPNPNPAPEDNHGHALRQFMRFESADGERWSEPTWAFARDDEDLKRDPYFQFYGVSVHPVGDLYVAFPWIYHSQEGTFDIGLAYSTDTVKWERPFRGHYVLPHAARGEWDGGCIVTAYHLIEKDGMWWLYYGGTPYDHHKLDTKRYMAIGLARMPIGRVVSARCFDTEGSWTIGPVKVTGRELLLNAAIFDNVCVTILDEQGEPIPGYTSQPVRGNDIELPVRWDNGKDWSSLSGRSVKLRFDMHDAEVFGFKSR